MPPDPDIADTENVRKVIILGVSQKSPSIVSYLKQNFLNERFFPNSAFSPNLEKFRL